MVPSGWFFPCRSDVSFVILAVLVSVSYPVTSLHYDLCSVSVNAVLRVHVCQEILAFVASCRSPKVAAGIQSR